MVVEVSPTNDLATTAPTCWVCGSGDVKLAKEGNLPRNLDSDAFRITDSDYGRTADIYACASCGFQMCHGFKNVLEFYESMDDAQYEATRDQRAIQARRLVSHIAKWKPSGRLLDVGAGSGILVEAALEAGFDAEGVEPSRVLQQEAERRKLPVQLGVLGQAKVKPSYDLVCLVDVIEHVPNPVQLLRDIKDVVSGGGVLLVVTPDVGSVAARLLGWKWWHYRIAHIGYFNRKTLERALTEAGFEVDSMTRPTWYFPVSYLCERLSTYLPKFMRFRPPSRIGRMTVPLNLFDSYCAIAVKPRER